MDPHGNFWSLIEPSGRSCATVILLAVMNVIIMIMRVELQKLCEKASACIHASTKAVKKKIYGLKGGGGVWICIPELRYLGLGT